MDLFGGYNWVWWFHILIGAPLLMSIPILYLKDGKVEPDVLHTWFYILIAVGSAMIIYHGMKLMRSLGFIKY